jgi:hypothetical protein
LSREILVRFLSAFDVKLAPFSPFQDERERSHGNEVSAVESGMYKKRLEARVGIEPTYKGFADLSLTTWVPRPGPDQPPMNKTLAGARGVVKIAGAGDGI